MYSSGASAKNAGLDFESLSFYYYTRRKSTLLRKIKIRTQGLRNYEEIVECLEGTGRQCYNVTELLRARRKCADVTEENSLDRFSCTCPLLQNGDLDEKIMEAYKKDHGGVGTL